MHRRRGYKAFSRSTHLSMKPFMLITFIVMINTLYLIHVVLEEEILLFFNIRECFMDSIIFIIL